MKPKRTKNTSLFATTFWALLLIAAPGQDSYGQTPRAHSTEDFFKHGITRKKLGDQRGALADYNQAIQLRPSFGLTYFNRSAVYKALGNGFEAEADFNRSLTMNDNPTTQLEPPLERVKAGMP